MSKLLTRPVGLFAPFITGSINSRYKISEYWINSSYDNSDEAWQIQSCKKCEDCICKTCRDIHKRVSISDTEVPELKHLDKLKLTKVNSHVVKLQNDDKECWITGLAITEDSKIIMVDFENRKVKLFGQYMRFVFSLSLQFHPWDIALVRGNRAAVSMSGRQLVLIGISEIDMSIKNTLKLPFDIYGVVAYQDKFIVTSMTNLSLPSVKLIDSTGKVYWSVPLNHKKKQIFKWPMYVSILNHDGTNSVVVTDSGNSTVTLLNAETGEFIKRNWLPCSTEPQCVTTDHQNNVYISFNGTNEVAVVSEDFSDSQVLLSKRGILGQWLYESSRHLDLEGKPWALGYDQIANQLIVSYDNRNIIDFYAVMKQCSDMTDRNLE